MSSSAARRARTQSLILLIAAIGALLLVQTLGRAFRDQGNDLTSYLLSAEALAAGNSPYATVSSFPYVYPPFLAFALIPLGKLPYAAAVTFWFLLNAGALAVAIRAAVRPCASRTGVRWGHEVSLPLALCSVLLLSPIQNNLLNGQVNFIVLALCVLCAAQVAAGRPWRGVVPLALAIAIKLTPALLLVFLVRRRFFGPAIAAAVAALLLCIVPAVFVGFDVSGLTGDFVHTAGDLVRHPPSFPGGYPSFGLAGVASRLWPPLHGNVPFTLACGAAVLLALILVDRRPEAGSGWRDLWSAQLYLLAMLLASPVSEKHHLAFVIPGAILLSLLVISGDERRRFATTGTVVLFWIALVVGMRVSAVPLHFAAIVALFVGLAHVLRRPDRPAASRVLPGSPA